MFRTLGCALLVCSGAALADHPLSKPKVYLGKEGLRGVVAELKSQADRCVVQVTGVSSALEGLVLDCRVVRRDARVGYYVLLRGRERMALGTNGEGAAGLTDVVGLLAYDEAETRKLDLAALWALHEQQVTAGKLEAVSRFDRVQEDAAIAKEVNAAVEPLNKACGTTMRVVVDWSNAPEELFKAAHPETNCIKMVVLMQGMCARWKVVRSTLAQKVSELRCTFGEAKPQFKLEGKTITASSNHETVSLPGAFDFWLQEAL